MLRNPNAELPNLRLNLLLLGFVPQPNLRLLLGFVPQPNLRLLLGFVPQTNLRLNLLLLGFVPQPNLRLLLGFVPQTNLRLFPIPCSLKAFEFSTGIKYDCYTIISSVQLDIIILK
ncbi:hypothetical protein [Okeania sp.]|uniref:hypothetical protein n=1 Tax=Okeania sp. TaxID=3100323 RepID=UPI002B4B37BD|nr:hypothetical protein [Okeania sp.]MEB3343022.1 hypothetical protein [Okeania sp.]